MKKQILFLKVDGKYFQRISPRNMKPIYTKKKSGAYVFDNKNIHQTIKDFKIGNYIIEMYEKVAEVTSEDIKDMEQALKEG